MKRWWSHHKAAMDARARRKIALDYAMINLRMWADYGDPDELARAIRKLEGQSPS